ncbi:MAG TPA: Nif3-like dinuclear metal center hexameric protein [Methylophilaceae bacterium]|jgi:dinuclear metal center YbgI/SA1388 family protein
MKTSELLNYTEQLLDAARFRDYCPNALQVQGKDEVNMLVSGVTASLALIEAAIVAKADAILVHHGWFWKNEDMRIVGTKHKRLKLLMQHDINLIAYHLPLDAHTELGNNAQLAKQLGLQIEGWFGEQNIAAYGQFPEAIDLRMLGARIKQTLGREPLVIGELSKIVHRVAWCTGAAQDYLDKAIALGADVFITGEASEQTVHLARESGVAFIAAGHHATERYGVQALGSHLADRFGVAHLFIDIENPV